MIHRCFHVSNVGNCNSCILFSLVYLQVEALLKLALESSLGLGIS